MPILSKNSQLVLGAILILLMAATRSHHFFSLDALPGASWAVFFLAGVYLRPAWVLYALLSLSWSIDFSEYLWGSGSTFCFSPAYGFLLPAYATLWLGGRWFARHYEYGIKGLTRLASAFFTSVVSCELFSSGGFYFLSGRFVNTSLAEFGERFVRYFPSSLKAMAFYVSLALVLHLALRLVAHRHSKARLTT